MFLKKDIACRFFVRDNRMLAERAFYCLVEMMAYEWRQNEKKNWNFSGGASAAV